MQQKVKKPGVLYSPCFVSVFFGIRPIIKKLPLALLKSKSLMWAKLQSMNAQREVSLKKTVPNCLYNFSCNIN